MLQSAATAVMAATRPIGTFGPDSILMGLAEGLRTPVDKATLRYASAGVRRR